MNARPAFSREAAQACLSACYEYLLITLPVALYVVLEAIHKADATFCLWSPEWAIATIFLAFQGHALYRRHLARTGRKLSDPMLGLFGMATLVVTVLAAINAYASLHENTIPAAAFRLLLFGLASATFVSMVSGAKLAHLNAERQRHAA